MAVAEVIVERKFKPDGTVREYTCELVKRRPGLLVLRYRLPDGGAGFNTPIEVPPRSVSFGWFWSRRPYLLYRMFGPDGALLGHRFDAATGLKILDASVEYRDLVLDWWVLPDGTILEEDRDELELLAADRILSDRELEAANAAAYQVLSRYRHIIDEVEQLEQQLHIVVEREA